ncbi:restriction endonuclease subunit S [Lactobacillus sp. LL6]|nr:restriction endonuclease subunit S [Lactobacillus sp. LL6]
MKTNSLEFDAQALREKILDLAMRGKLVKQDPTDEPASVLLEKIKAEKEELVKEGKIKKSKALPEITDTEKPFDIPDSWEWVRLGEVIALISGRDITKKDHLSTPDVNSMPYITGASNINNQGIINITEWVNNPSVIVEQGTLLLSVKGTIGKIAILDIPKAHIARQIMGIKNIYNLNRDFQKYFIEYYVKELQSKAKSMIPGVSRDDLLLASVPFPPLEEQSRIAAKIAELFALLRKVESSNQQYDEFKKMLRSKVLDLAMRGKLVKQNPDDKPASVLLEKIKAEKAELVKEGKIKKSKKLPEITDDEKPFDISDSWEWVRLGEIYDFIDYRGKTPHKISSGIRLITAKNVRMGYISVKPEEFISKTEFVERSTRGDVVKGDIFITTEAPMGLIAINDFDEPIATAQRLITLRKVSNLQNNKFMSYFMQSNIFQKFLNEKATGSTVKGIKAANLKQVLILMPPLEEQQRIVNQIESIMKMIN